MAGILSPQELGQEQGFLYPQEARAFLELIERGRTDGVSCWRSPEVERRDGSAIEGKGLFALEDIPVNSLIAIKQGHVVSSRDIKDRADIIKGSQQQIGPNEFLAGITDEEVDKNLVGYNHSCNPNSKVVIPRGASLAFVVTREPVEAGQEITADYSASQMTNTHLLKLCQCGTPECRGVVAPLWDWEDKGIQEKYAGELPWFIQDAIDERNNLPPDERDGLLRSHATLKIAALSLMADEEVKRLETQRENALSPIEGRLLRAIMGRVYDRRPAGRELEAIKSKRLQAIALFSVICPFANIEELGIERSEIADALHARGGDADALSSQLDEKMDEILLFAKNLDYFFNR